MVVVSLFPPFSDPDLTRANLDNRQHPESSSPSAPLLLGLLHVNASKNPLLPGGDLARAAEYERGLVLIQQAFKRDNTSSAAAAMGPLSSQYLSQGGPGASAAALKLAERMLAFADARLLVAEARAPSTPIPRPPRSMPPKSSRVIPAPSKRTPN